MMYQRIPACKLLFQFYCTTRVISLHTKLNTTTWLNDWPVAKVNESTKYSCPRKFKISASKITQLEEEASFDWSFDLRDELLLCLCLLLSQCLEGITSPCMHLQFSTAFHLWFHIVMVPKGMHITKCLPQGSKGKRISHNPCLFSISIFNHFEPSFNFGHKQWWTWGPTLLNRCMAFPLGVPFPPTSSPLWVQKVFLAVQFGGRCLP
jgi:hypothetical protein